MGRWYIVSSSNDLTKSEGCFGVGVEEIFTVGSDKQEEKKIIVIQVNITRYTISFDKGTHDVETDSPIAVWALPLQLPAFHVS